MSPLVAALRGKAHEQLTAAAVLGERGPRTSASLLVPLLSSEYPLVRYWARAAVERLLDRTLPVDLDGEAGGRSSARRGRSSARRPRRGDPRARPGVISPRMSRPILLALTVALVAPATACRTIRPSFGRRQRWSLLLRPKPPPARRRPPRSPSSAATAAEPPRKKREGPCSKDANVTFTDATLEGAVRVQLQKPTGAIARADLGKVKTLNLSQAPTDDEIDPCLFPLFTGVKGLYLAPGKLDDLTPLKTLTSIESLRVSITRVADLGPLAGLVKLDRLDAGRTPVSDLSPLAACVNLTELQLDQTEVSDLGPLAKLKKLEKLSIKKTKVSDVSPLKDLTKLKHLYIEGSLVKDTSPVRSANPSIRIHSD